MFRIGDKVWDLSYGWGEVVDFDIDYKHPIVVQFEHRQITYTEDGKQYAEFNRDLFFSEIPIPPSALERPRWRARHMEKYYYINSSGYINVAYEIDVCPDEKAFRSGNYFQTEEEAKASKFYKVFHD